MPVKIILFFCLILVGCNNCEDNRNYSVYSASESHEEKLRRHFTGIGERVDDISTLIAETRAISGKLKRAGLTERANKFDSYTDVLMFGNRTVDESLDDVMKLVKSGGGAAGTGVAGNAGNAEDAGGVGVDGANGSHNAVPAKQRAGNESCAAVFKRWLCSSCKRCP